MMTRSVQCKCLMMYRREMGVLDLRNVLKSAIEIRLLLYVRSCTSHNDTAKMRG